MNKEMLEKIRHFLEENQEIFDKRDRFFMEIEETLEITQQDDRSVLIVIREQ